MAEEEFESKIEHMKKMAVVEDRTVKFFNLLMQDPDKVAAFLSVKEVQKRLAEFNFQEVFKNYFALLKKKIEKGLNLAWWNKDGKS